MIDQLRMAANKIAYEYCAGQPTFEEWSECTRKTADKIVEDMLVKAYMRLEALFEQCLARRLKSEAIFEAGRADPEIFRKCIDEKMGWGSEP